MKDIGTIRAIGASRRQILSLLILEWLVLGLLGSLAGVGLGYLLAEGLLQVTTGAINALIPLVTITRMTFPPQAVAAALIIGIGTTLFGAYGPTRHALEIPAIEAVRPHTYRLAKSYLRQFVWGLGLTLVGAALVALILRYPYVGLASVGLIFWGLAMMLPQFMLELAGGVRGVFQKVSSIEGFLAADNMVKFPQRTALTIVTLAGALGMMIATATLVDGLRVATTRWLVQAFPFDFAVTSSSLASSLYSQHTVPRALVEQLQKVEGVESVCAFRTAFSDYQRKDILVMGIETLPYLEMNRQEAESPWARALSRPEDVSKFRSGEGVLVSENFAYFFNLHTGDTITFKTPSGPHSALILRTVEDYSWPHGVVILDLDVMGRMWNDSSITYIGIGVRPGSPSDIMRARIGETLSGTSSVFLYAMEEIRRIGREILDQTVALANIQVLIAIFIGSLGIVNTLLISVIQRSREIGLLRAVGMTALASRGHSCLGRGPDGSRRKPDRHGRGTARRLGPGSLLRAEYDRLSHSGRPPLGAYHHRPGARRGDRGGGECRSRAAGRELGHSRCDRLRVSCPHTAARLVRSSTAHSRPGFRSRPRQSDRRHRVGPCPAPRVS